MRGSPSSATSTLFGVRSLSASPTACTAWTSSARQPEEVSGERPADTWVSVGPLGDPLAQPDALDELLRQEEVAALLEQLALLRGDV
jgi:hypothetical protein